MVTKVFMCSAYKGSDGNYEENYELAELLCRAILRCGAMPMAPHVFYHHFANDLVLNDREIGIQLGELLLRNADLMICVLGVGGSASEGMNREIEQAIELGIPVATLPDAPGKLLMEWIREVTAVIESEGMKVSDFDDPQFMLPMPPEDMEPLRGRFYDGNMDKDVLGDEVGERGL